MIHRDLRIVFMGTPSFAVPSLRFLCEAGYPVVAVITAPDKPGGRGMKELLISPVKSYALEHGLDVLQPANLKSPIFLERLQTYHADLFVVVAFRMLPEVVWSMPRQGTFNLHGSLLPAYRGAAPIQRAIMAGETTTGITTFFLQRDIDTGEILLQKEIAITPDDDAGTLHDRMMMAGAGLVVATADLITSGNAVTRPQDSSKASHAPKIHHGDTVIHWHKSAIEIHNLIRGLSPFPGARTMLDGTELKIYKTKQTERASTKPAGSLELNQKQLLVHSGNGQLELVEVQLAGKRKMKTPDFLNGYKIKDWSLT